MLLGTSARVLGQHGQGPGQTGRGGGPQESAQHRRCTAPGFAVRVLSLRIEKDGIRCNYSVLGQMTTLCPEEMMIMERMNTAKYLETSQAARHIGTRKKQTQRGERESTPEPLITTCKELHVHTLQVEIKKSQNVCNNTVNNVGEMFLNVLKNFRRLLMGYLKCV